MQAIRTKFHGPTNSKGSRVSAKCEAKTIYVSWDHSLNSEQNHKAAAEKLRSVMGWNTPFYGDIVGGEFDGNHYWVFDDRRLQALTNMVNSIRESTWSGNPWAKPEFRNAVESVGRAHGFYGDALQAPTKPEEIAAFKAGKNA